MLEKGQSQQALPKTRSLLSFSVRIHLVLTKSLSPCDIINKKFKLSNKMGIKTMKKMSKRILALLTAAVLAISLMSACANNAGASDEGDGQSATGACDAQGQPSAGAGAQSVGDFTTQDLDGNTVTQDIFAENELTMVNVFATWCSPCVAEMPDLEELHQQMKDKDVGVVGVVLDVLNENGEIVDEDLESAQLLVDETGVTYPVLLPDSTYFNGRLTGIEALPETFFVDSSGNIVGEKYVGSGGLEDWTKVVETELANLKEGE